MLEIPLRIFYHSSFDDPNEIKNILAEMPDFDKFQQDRQKIKKINTNKISPEMLPCYESPLLSKEQEQHLFRKMNYFKYKVKTLFSSKSRRRDFLIKSYLNKSDEIRNLIAESNFRLSAQILKGQVSFYREHSLIEGLLSDAYFDVLKSVDYFDWTLGNKFSTYATWVIRKNFYRDSKQKIQYVEKFEYLDDSSAEQIQSRGNQIEEEQSQKDQQQLIGSLLGLAEKEGMDRKRQMYVIENYFGLNGKDKKTLEKISLEMKITKERVRQLKEKGLKWLKIKAKQLDLQ